MDMVSKENGIRDDMRFIVNSTIKKVGEDYERMKFNTAISAMMAMVNEVYAKGSITRDELRTLLLLLSPVSPHICEEMNERLGFGEPIYASKWPEWDENTIQSDNIEYGIQINGKVKTRITLPAEYSKEDIEKSVLDNAEVKVLLEGHDIRKVIVVKNIVNIVVAK